VIKEVAIQITQYELVQMLLAFDLLGTYELTKAGIPGRHVHGQGKQVGVVNRLFVTTCNVQEPHVIEM